MCYFNWFKKNFPNDSAYGKFIFEWAITCFKKKKVKEAETRMLETFVSITFLIDVFLGNELIDFRKKNLSNWEKSNAIEQLKYSKDEKNYMTLQFG